MPWRITGTAAVPSVGDMGRPNRPVYESHVSFTPRPVLVPPCRFRPFRIRALNDRSKPCQ